MTRDSTIAGLAAQQHGVVARRQLLELGIGPRVIERGVLAGRLHPIHRGVYAVGHPLLTQHGKWMAAVLAVGSGAALSHRSAAALWRMAEVPDAPIEVLVRDSARRTRKGIRVHRSTRIADGELTVRNGIPVTSATRTLLDLATRVGPRALRAAFNEAERRNLLDRSQLARLCERARGRRGTGTLRALLAAPSLPLSETRSELERRFLRFCRDRGLPIPGVNVPLAGYLVDCLWPEHRVVVELDSWAHHGDRGSFEADRRRDARIQRAGHRVIRVTKRRITEDGNALEEELRALLGLAVPT
jgi:very-short-patch-repair endonuclease